MSEPSAPELDVMRRITREAMYDGAFGIASTLIYPPENFATTGELIEICKKIAPRGGVYISHIRSEADNFLESLDEAIEIGKRAGVSVEIYHLKAASIRNWYKAALTIPKRLSSAACISKKGDAYEGPLQRVVMRHDESPPRIVSARNRDSAAQLHGRDLKT